ncbi:MAG: hypothetical protein RLZZ37_508 [Actinomycetota bacterium]|jgi:hypothetical protein
MVPRSFNYDLSKISFDRLDGEVIIVDLESGSYYCTSQTGSDIWTLVVQGVSTEQILLILNEKYLGKLTELENDINAFVDKLEEIKLIYPVKNNELIDFIFPEDQNRSKWIKPVIEEYTDMWDLIKMDPIHESNEKQGWPEKKVEN